MLRPVAFRLGCVAALTGAGSLPAAEQFSAEALRALRAPPAAECRENLREAAAVPFVSGDAEPVASRGGYAAWAAEVFTPEELADPDASAPDAVYGADGISNLEKYALAIDPRADGTARLPEAGQLGEHWFLWYCRPSEVDDVEYRVEVSTDGVNWTTEGVTQEPILADELAESWQAHYQAAEGQTVWFRFAPVLR